MVNKDINKRLKLGAIPSVNKINSLSISKQHKENTRITLYVNSKTYELFENLKVCFAHKNKNYSFSDSKMILTSISFMKDSFIKGGIFKDAPEDFVSKITKKGKRKNTSRTPKKEDKKVLYFLIPNNIIKDFNDIIFSYAIKFDKENAYEDFYSRAYFLTDLLDYLKKNKKQFLSYK